MNSKLDNDEYTDEDEYGSLSSKNLVIAIVIVSIFGFALMIGFQPSPEQGGVMAATQDGDNLVINLADVNPEVKFYYYEFTDVKIQFFAVLGEDDQPHIAFDACDSCYAAKKGYLHANPYMKCNNCGRTFLVTSIGTENLAGGCWPSYLPVVITDGKILIKISDVTQKLFMFS